MKKDRLRLSFFHWCVDTNQRRIQISARTQSYTHTRMYVEQIVYFAEKFLVHLSPPEPAAHEYSSVWGGYVVGYGMGGEVGYRVW